MQAQAIHPSGGTADGRSPAKARGPGKSREEARGPFSPRAVDILQRWESCKPRRGGKVYGGEVRRGHLLL